MAGMIRRFCPRFSLSALVIAVTIWAYSPGLSVAGPPAAEEQHAITDSKQDDVLTLRSDPDVFEPVDVEVTALSGQEFSVDEKAAPTNRQIVVVAALVPLQLQTIEFQRVFLHARGHHMHRDTPRYLSYTAQRATVDDNSDVLDWKLISYTNAERQRQSADWESRPTPLEELADSRFVSFPLTMPVDSLVGPSLASQCLHSTVPRQAGQNSDGRTAKHLMIRFNDRTVEVGKKYRYRVGAFLSDPNRPEFPEWDPVFGDLDYEVQERITALKKQEQSSGPRRYFYRRTPWSEPSRIVEVQPPPQGNLEVPVSRLRRINKSELVCLVYTSQWRIRPHRDGLILGVWTDGTIVWSLDDLRGGPPYFQSKIDPDRFRKLREKLRAEGALTDRSLSTTYGSPFESFMPCTDDTRIILYDGDESLDMQSWHEFEEAAGRIATSRESLDPAVAKWNVLFDEPKEYLRFRLAWSEIRLGLQRLIPKDGDQVDGSLLFSHGPVAWIESPVK